jgi:hypothetical protein
MIGGTTKVITPIIHMNGDTEKELLRQLRDVYLAVQNAIDALRLAAPNPRNYCLEAGRFAKAMAQHRERMLALHGVRDSLIEESQAIQRKQ